MLNFQKYFLIILDKAINNHIFPDFPRYPQKRINVEVLRKYSHNHLNVSLRILIQELYLQVMQILEV